eukprot:316391_1
MQNDDVLQINEESKHNLTTDDEPKKKNLNNRDAKNMEELRKWCAHINSIDTQTYVIDSTHLIQPFNKWKYMNRKCEVKECNGVLTISQVLKKYQLYLKQKLNILAENSNSQSPDIENIFGEDFHEFNLLNQFNHLLTSHDDQLEEIYNIILQHCEKCDLSQCLMMKRNHRDRAVLIDDNHKLNELYFNDNITMQQLIDRIHCHIFHTFDIGFKMMQQEKNNILEYKYNVPDDEDQLLYDVNITQLSNLLKMKQDKYKNVQGLDRLNNHNDNNKFMLLPQENEQKTSEYSYGIRYFYW